MKHKHHITPRHMGGTDDISNLVEVSVEEHAELHFDLYLQHGHIEDWIAAHMLSGKTTEGEVAMNQMRAEYMTNRVITDECRKNMSEGQKRRTDYPRGEDHWDCKGEKNPFYGKTHNTNTKKLCRQGALKQWEQKLIWVTNGKDNKRVVKEEIPEGFWKGRTMKSK